MKNLYLLFIAFLLPTIANAQYYFSAQVSRTDPCCISIEAGAHGKNKDINQDNWEVVVDGITTYNHANNGNEFLHCVEGNGIHSVQFFVNGELYWTENVEITGCEGDCSVCEMEPMEVVPYPILDQPCDVFFCVEYLQYSSECTNPQFTWDFGDDNTSGPSNSPHALHTYDEDGTYTACVSLTVTNPDGEPCTISQCIEVVVEGCTPPEPCCGFSLDGPSYMIAPWDPCLVRLNPGSYGYSGECLPLTFSWDVDGDGTIEQTGSSSYFTTSFDGPGPHTVCVTMSHEECEISDCTTFELPNCEEEGGRYKGDLAMQMTPTIDLFPNPTVDRLNVTLPKNVWNPSEVILIMDAAGNMVARHQIATTDQQSINVSSLASGIYFIRVMDKEGIVATEKFVKMK